MRRMILGILFVLAIANAELSLAAALPRMKVELSEASVYPGVTVHGQVKLGTPAVPFTNLAGIGFRVKYDQASFFMAYFEQGDILTGDGSLQFARINQSTGLASFSTATTNGIGVNGSGVVALFDLYLNASIVGGSYIISLNDIQAVNAKGQPILFQAVSDTLVVLAGVSSAGPGAGAGALQLTRPYPNPLQDRTQVTLNLPTARTVRVAVYDSAGRLVRQVLTAELAAGTHSIAWDARREDGSRAAAGIYFLSFSDGISVQSVAVTVLR